MNDQVLMNNYLLLLKSTTEVYVHGTLESVNEAVHNLLKECLNDTICMQSNTFHTMTQYGWYNIENISTQEIKKVYDKLQDE